MVDGFEHRPITSRAYLAASHSAPEIRPSSGFRTAITSGQRGQEGFEHSLITSTKRFQVNGDISLTSIGGGGVITPADFFARSKIGKGDKVASSPQAGEPEEPGPCCVLSGPATTNAYILKLWRQARTVHT